MCHYITWTCLGVLGRKEKHLKRLEITKECSNLGACNFVNDISLRDEERFNETCAECEEMKKQTARPGREKVTARQRGRFHPYGHRR
jgi:hypothetical protein